MSYRNHGFYRYWLAIGVLISHYFVVFFPELSAVQNLQLGNIAVASFFVLSGYLMNEALSTVYQDSPRRFILNRYLRITPTFLLAGALSALIHHVVAGVDGQLFQYTPEVRLDGIHGENAASSMLQAVFPFNLIFYKIASYGGIDLTGEYAYVRYAWAIFTELIFYWFIFAFYLAQRVNGFLAKLFYGLCLIVSVLGIYSAHAEAPLIRLPWDHHFQWGFHFLLGVSLSWCYREGQGRNALKFLLVGLYFIGALTQLGLYASNGTGQIWLILLIYSYCQFILYRIINQRGLTQLMTPRTDQMFGSLSYPIYINQYALSILFIVVANALLPDFSRLGWEIRVLLFAGYFAFVVLACYVIEKLVQLMTMELRDRIRGSRIAAT